MTDTTDPVKLVRTLDPDAIRARLQRMDRERAALMVLLRAAINATDNNHHPNATAKNRKAVRA